MIDFSSEKYSGSTGHRNSSNFLEVETLSVGRVICGRTVLACYLLNENETFSNKTKVFKDGSTKVERTIHVYLEAET